MTVLFRNFFFILIFSGASILKAQNASDALVQMLNPMQSIEADFTQTVLDSKNRPIQTSSGNMILQKPGLFLWEVEAPSPQKIIADGKRLWVYDIALEQITERDQKEALQNSPALLLSGSLEKNLKTYAVTVSQGSNETIFLLKPIQKQTSFIQMKLFYQNRLLKKMILVDGLGHQNCFEFTQVQYNNARPLNFFKFTPPKGVDVIRE